MKARSLLPRISHRALAVGAILALAAPLASAQTGVVWRTPDPDGIGGAGDWNTTDLNWREGTDPNRAWINDFQYFAAFQAPTSGKPAGPVNVTENVDANKIRFQTTGYTLNGTGNITLRSATADPAIELSTPGSGTNRVDNNLLVDLANWGTNNSINARIVRQLGTAGGTTLRLDGDITLFSSASLGDGNRTVRIDFGVSGTAESASRLILNGDMSVDTSANFGTGTTNALMRFGETGNNFAVYEVNGDNSAIDFGTTSANLTRGTVLAGHDNALGAGRVDMSFSGGNDSYVALLANGARTLDNNIQWTSSGAVTDQSNLVREFGGATAHVSNFTGDINITNPQSGATTTQTVRFSAVEGGRANFTGPMNDNGLTRFESTGAGVVNLEASAGITGTGAGSGGFDVLAGTLLVNNQTGSATGGGPVTVAAGATLGGAGFISGVTTVDGIIAPGNSIGTLTIDNTVTWNYNSGSDWKFELGTAGADINTPGTSDFLNITGGNFTMGTGTGFGFDFEGTGELGWYHLVQWSGTSNFDASDFFATNLAGGLQGTFDISNDGLYLNVIPEPSTAGLLAVALLGYAVYSRRRAARTATQVA